MTEQIKNPNWEKKNNDTALTAALVSFASESNRAKYKEPLQELERNPGEKRVIKAENNPDLSTQEKMRKLLEDAGVLEDWIRQLSTKEKSNS